MELTIVLLHKHYCSPCSFLSWIVALSIKFSSSQHLQVTLMVSWLACPQCNNQNLMIKTMIQKKYERGNVDQMISVSQSFEMPLYLLAFRNMCCLLDPITAPHEDAGRMYSHSLNLVRINIQQTIPTKQLKTQLNSAGKKLQNSG